MAAFPVALGAHQPRLAADECCSRVPSLPRAHTVLAMTLAGHQFPNVHSSLGADLRALGCVMLDTEQPPISIEETLANLDARLYYSADPAKHW